MPVLNATPDQLTQLQAALSALELQMQSVTALALARRYAFWTELAVAAQGVVDPAVVSANLQADKDAAGYAMLLGALRRGELSVVAWAVGSEGGAMGPVQLGIARAGADPATLGQWALLPIIVRVAVQVVAGVGAWVIANAWTHAKDLEAKADQVRAQTQQQISARVTALAATNPQAATALADALARANTAAGGAAPGLLDSLADAVKSVGTGVGSGLSSGLLWALAAWFFFRRRAL